MSLCKSQLQSMANAIRFLSADAIEKSKSGHPGMPLGMADVATVLFSKFIKLDAANPRWFDRDRFVLSAGHGSYDALGGYFIWPATRIFASTTSRIFASSGPKPPATRSTDTWPGLI